MSSMTNDYWYPPLFFLQVVYEEVYSTHHRMSPHRIIPFKYIPSINLSCRSIKGHSCTAVPNCVKIHDEQFLPITKQHWICLQWAKWRHPLEVWNLANKIRCVSSLDPPNFFPNAKCNGLLSKPPVNCVAQLGPIWFTWFRSLFNQYYSLASRGSCKLMAPMAARLRFCCTEIYVGECCTMDWIKCGGANIVEVFTQIEQHAN